MTLPARRPPHPIGGVTRGWRRRGVPGYCPHLRSQNEGAPRGGRTPRGTRRCHASLVPPQWHVAPEAPTITFRLTWFANILLVSHRCRPAVGPSSACRSVALAIPPKGRGRSRSGSKSKSKHAARMQQKLLTPPVGSVSPNGIQTHRRGYASQSTLKKRGPSRGTLPL